MARPLTGFALLACFLAVFPHPRHTMSHFPQKHTHWRRVVSATICVFSLCQTLAITPAAAATTVPASFAITGSGNGHGVGMSQWGAQGMARDGHTYQQILAHYYIGTTLTTTDLLPASKRKPSIRVGLIRDALHVAIRGEALGAGGGALDVTVAGVTKTVAAGTTVTLSISGANAHVVFPDSTSADGPSVQVAWNRTTTNGDHQGLVNVVEYDPATKSAGSALGSQCVGTLGDSGTYSGSCNHRYRYGSLDIAAGAFGSGDSTVDLNVVLIERLDDEYVRGIGEVPSSWRTHALRAQAVAARSYALATVIAGGIRSSCKCHVLPDTSDQNYVGFSKEYASLGSNWVSAVTDTMTGNYGQVVMSGATVVKTFFAASTGGRSQPVSQVWGSTSMPWLGEVDDHWSLDAPNPDAVWLDSISQSTLRSRLNSALAKAYTSAHNAGSSCSKVQLPDIAAMSIGAKYSSTAVSRLDLADSAGNTYSISIKPARGCSVISPDRLRSVLGVRSTYLSGISPSDGTAPASGLKPKKLTALKVTSWPSAVTNGSSFTFRGSVSPKQYGVTVTLEEKIEGKWTQRAMTATSMKGTWALTWTTPNISVHSMRVVARNSKGPKASTTHSIPVTGVISAVVPARGKARKTVIVSGTVTPIYEGAVVTIERKSTTKWIRIASTTVAADGTWTAPVPLGRKRGKLYVRAHIKDPRIGDTTTRRYKVLVQ